MVLDRAKSLDKLSARPLNAAASSGQRIYQSIVDYIETINEERIKAKNGNKTEFENRLVMRRRCIEIGDHYKKLEANVLMGGDDAMFINEEDDNQSVKAGKWYEGSRNFDEASEVTMSDYLDGVGDNNPILNSV